MPAATSTSIREPLRDRLMERSILEEIAWAGVQAPSADNGLEYGFEYQDAAICIWAGAGVLANTERHRRVLDLFAFGAMAENMRLRAGQFGLDGAIRWFPSDDPGLIARIELQPRPGLGVDPLAAAIAARQTNRHLVFKGPLSAAHKAGLAEKAQEIEGVRVQWLDGDRRQAALKLIWQAESARFQSRRLHDELFSSVRFDLGWKGSADRGLPPAALEVEPPMRPMFSALRHWPLMHFLNFFGMHRVMGLRAGYLPCRLAPALAVVTTTLPLEPGALAAGRGFERLWLEATRQELVLQPMAASVVLPLQSDADQGLPRAARESLAEGWRTICGGELPLMACRVGCAAGTKAPSVRTGRRPIASYTRNS
ncbi:MAG: hypothetical protein ABW005_01670 [Burkholderiaceae bacterium]